MRQRIIDVLDYPRRLALDNLAPIRCPHHGVFDGRDPDCRACHFATDCEFLVKDPELDHLADGEVEDLERVLANAVEYVEGLATTCGHDVATCVCDGCTWLREARPVLSARH